jgi:site-specific DNA recombinase
MRVAVYARVSTTRQAQAQGIEQQLDRLRAAVAVRGWELEDQYVYRDDGYSGARIGRPGLDRLRDHAALADLDVVVVTAPDRLARNYVHQVLLIDELAARGCQVEFLDRPMSADPHDQLLLQIRGAVAEYERTLIAERMRRGRQAKLRAGTLLPWTTAPFGYRLDPERPRRADVVRTEPGEAALVAQLFDWYLEPQATVYRLARRLTDLGVPTPRGGPRWNTASVRGILRNPSYAGRALSNRTQVAPARGRKSAMLPAGPGISHAPRPEEDWIAVPVPPIVSEQTFAQVQAKLDANQQGAARNTRHEYLLRALISCGACRLGCTGRQTAAGYRYYLCRGRTDPLRVAQGERCTARYIPAGQLDELVWADLCALLTDPAHLTRALARAQGGAWLPQELQARQATIGQALGQLDRQQQRLLDAYLAEVIALAELERKRQDLDRRRATLLAQQRQLDAAARQKQELGAVADGIEAFCQTVRAGLATATFEQRRLLAELLIDRVVVTDGQVEIRYVLPTSPDGPHRPFCQLRKDHLDPPSDRGQAHEFGDGGIWREGGQPVIGGLIGLGGPLGQQPAFREAAVGRAGDVPVGGADPDGQETAGHGGGGVALSGFSALPPGHLPGLAGVGDGELAQVRRWARVGGLGRAPGLAAALAGHRLRRALMRAGGAVDCQHVVPAAVFQFQPEGGVVPIARIGHQHRPRAPGGGDLPAGPPSAGPSHLVNHLQRQPPLPGMAHLIRDARPLAAPPCAGRLSGIIELGVVPALWAKQPPVRGARGVLVHQVHADPDLAVADRAQRAGVLPGHARRRGPVRGEPSVVHHQRLHPLTGSKPPADVPPHRHVIPGRGRDELLQPLMVHSQPRRHRLHRLTPPIRQQPTHIQLTGRPLILTRQPAEHLRGERHQPGPDLRNLLRVHPGMTVQRPGQTRATRRNLTKSY